jgi:hypothetical protein
MHYNISQPVDNVFNNIDDFSDLAKSASSPITSQQMIDLAYVILAKHPILQPDLRLWNRKPGAEHTWENMMAHLRDAQSDLSSLPTAGDMYHQPPPHQANITTMAELIAQHLLDDPRLMPSPPPAPPILPPPPLLETPAAPLTDMANSLQCRETDLQTREASMTNQMQEMMMLMCTGNNHNNGGNNNQNNGGIIGYNQNNGGNNGHNQNNGGNNLATTKLATIAMATLARPLVVVVDARVDALTIAEHAQRARIVGRMVPASIPALTATLRPTAIRLQQPLRTLRTVVRMAGAIGWTDRLGPQILTI